MNVCVYFQDAFSLLAYSDPWSSPVGAQLDPVQREPVCAALNSAILGKTFQYFIVPFYSLDRQDLENSICPDQTLLNVVSGQGLHCLLLIQ